MAVGTLLKLRPTACCLVFSATVHEGELRSHYLSMHLHSKLFSMFRYTLTTHTLNITTKFLSPLCCLHSRDKFVKTTVQTQCSEFLTGITSFATGEETLSPGLPMTHDLHVFDALEPEFTPFKFVLCVELTL